MKTPLILSITCIIIAVCAISVSADSAADKECFHKFDSLLSYDDSVKVTDSRGMSYSGRLKKIGKDSVSVRYLSSPIHKTFVQQNFTYDKIVQLEAYGYRDTYKILSRHHSHVLFAGIGCIAGYIVSENDNSLDYQNIFIGGLGGLIIGEGFFRLTSKTIPINIKINCE